MVSTPAKTSDVTPSLSTMVGEVDYLLAAIEQAEQDGDLENVETAKNFIDSVLVPAIQKKADALSYVLKFKLPQIEQERKEYLDQVKDWAAQPKNQAESLKALLKHLYESGRLDNVLVDGALLGEQHQLSFSTMEKPAIDVEEDAAEEWTEEEIQMFANIKKTLVVSKEKLADALKQGKPLPKGVNYRYPTRLTIGMRKDSKKK